MMLEGLEHVGLISIKGSATNSLSGTNVSVACCHIVTSPVFQTCLLFHFYISILRQGTEVRLTLKSSSSSCVKEQEMGQCEHSTWSIRHISIHRGLFRNRLLWAVCLPNVSVSEIGRAIALNGVAPPPYPPTCPQHPILKSAGNKECC